MNKSIVKHELRSMKWMMLASIVASLSLIMIFANTLDREYVRMFSAGIYANNPVILNAFRDLAEFTLVIFTGISLIQVFMQFKSEKSQETGRFLKSLPVKREEFFKIKLISGLINLSIAFIVLAIGFAVVRNNNMFWIKDIYKISYISEILINLESISILLKELGLIYLIVLSFYTFLFMIQYTFSNVVGGLVTGVLVWLAPIFIVISSIFTLSRFGFIDIYSSSLANTIDNLSSWLLPWSYIFDFDYVDNLNIENSAPMIRTIADLNIKYIISIVLIGVNTIIAYKFNKNSKVEDENKIITFKAAQNIFKIGVTVCSGLLVSVGIGNSMIMDNYNILYIALIFSGAFIGYLVSRKISTVGSI